MLQDDIEPKPVEDDEDNKKLSQLQQLQKRKKNLSDMEVDVQQDLESLGEPEEGEINTGSETDERARTAKTNPQKPSQEDELYEEDDEEDDEDDNDNDNQSNESSSTLNQSQKSKSLSFTPPSLIHPNLLSSLQSMQQQTQVPLATSIELLELATDEATGQILINDNDVKRIHAISKSRGNFAALLVQQMYARHERIMSNVMGTRGKRQLSPRRMTVVRRLSFKMYPGDEREEETIWKKECVKAIDSKNRKVRINPGGSGSGSNLNLASTSLTSVGGRQGQGQGQGSRFSLGGQLSSHLSGGRARRVQLRQWLLRWPLLQLLRLCPRTRVIDRPIKPAKC